MNFIQIVSVYQLLMLIRGTQLTQSQEQIDERFGTCHAMTNVRTMFRLELHVRGRAWELDW